MYQYHTTSDCHTTSGYHTHLGACSSEEANKEANKTEHTLCIRTSPRLFRMKIRITTQYLIYYTISGSMLSAYAVHTHLAGSGPTVGRAVPLINASEIRPQLPDVGLVEVPEL